MGSRVPTWAWSRSSSLLATTSLDSVWDSSPRSLDSVLVDASREERTLASSAAAPLFSSSAPDRAASSSAVRPSACSSRSWSWASSFRWAAAVSSI